MPRARATSSRASRSKKRKSPPLFSRVALTALLLCGGVNAWGQFPASAPAATDIPTEQQTIPPQTLARMYQAELGTAYRAEDLPKLLAAHALIENYFATGNSAQRGQIAGQLDATGLDVAVLGKLARLRMHWPDFPGGAVYYINQRRGPYDARYFVGLPPGYDRSQAWPLVVKLPTTQAFVGNPPPDAHEQVRIYTAWIKDELARHADAVVVMPLLDLKELYGPSYAGMNDALQPIMDVADRVNIDPSRVYLIGHSEAAHATWNLALHCPTYFAAINPLAGAAGADWQRLRLVNLSNVLPVVWADDDDQVINPSGSKSIVNALRKLNLDVDFVETQNLGHAPTDPVVEECYQKTRARTRELYPTSVMLQSNRPDSVFNRNDWVQIWQPFTPGDDRRLYFRHGSGYMVIDQNTWRVNATLAANRFTVTTDNVELFRLYVNDQMCDLRQPITVLVNGKVRFNGVVKPSAADMLKDQALLGRGWRYYCGTIDIDLSGPSAKPTTEPSPHKGRIIVGPEDGQ
jgi:predicted esterase